MVTLATPGATHMEIVALPDGAVRVRCPHCRFERTYAADATPEYFEHVSAECPIATVVILALEAYRFGCGWEIHG